VLGSTIVCRIEDPKGGENLIASSYRVNEALQVPLGVANQETRNVLDHEVPGTEAQDGFGKGLQEAVSWVFGSSSSND
jgi:hypothetical protein